MNIKTTLVGYALAAVNAAGAYMQANGDWAHMNWQTLGMSVLFALAGHLQADAKKL